METCKSNSVVDKIQEIAPIEDNAAHTLNTDSISTHRRFVSLRGYPERIWDNCGTNFTSTEKELHPSIAEWNQEKIRTFCTQILKAKGITPIYSRMESRKNSHLLHTNIKVHIKRNYIILCPFCDVTSPLICINQNLE